MYDACGDPFPIRVERESEEHGFFIFAAFLEDVSSGKKLVCVFEKGDFSCRSFGFRVKH